MKSLLQKVSQIVHKYKVIKKVSPYNFNIFSTLKIETKEVLTHSNLISELLNPQGSHNLGARFLKVFLEHVGLEYSTSTTVHVETEKYIGSISNDGSTGGFIDIYVGSDDWSFIIENKIYATDQPSQLLRYHNFSPASAILFLTLDGKEPSESSCSGVPPESIKTIAYGKEILLWLKECQAIAVNSPFVRETIGQYMYLIKKLTNQSINDEENMKIVDEVIKDHDSIRAFLRLQESSQAIYSELQNFIVKAVREVVSPYGDVVFTKGALSEKFGGFEIAFKKYPDQVLSFEFQQSNLQELIFGFITERNNTLNRDTVKNVCNMHFKNDMCQSETWSAYRYWHEYRRWSNSHYEMLLDGTFNSDLRSLLDKVLVVLDDLHSTAV